jgi:hypothetical protein
MWSLDIKMAVTSICPIYCTEKNQRPPKNKKDKERNPHENKGYIKDGVVKLLVVWKCKSN